MPIYCNYCDVQKQCPDGKGVLRKDQTELIVCKRRKEFRSIIGEAGSNDRQGLISYIHRLRGINAIRIGREAFKESLQNNGQNRYLSLLIDKQIDNCLAEYRLLLPQDKNAGKFSFHLTQVHNTVDAFTELPTDVKSYLIQALKFKLTQFKNPIKATNDNNTNTINNLNDNTNTIINPFPLPFTPATLQREAVAGSGGISNSNSVEEL